jgi:hypothetical protein
MTPMTTLESILSASATGGIFVVKGRKFALTPWSFPDGPVRPMKLVATLGSVPQPFMTAVTFRPGSSRSIRAWHWRQWVL